MTAAERERIAALETALEHHINWSIDFDKRITADLHELKAAASSSSEWQDRRSGVEALGKFLLPFIAVCIAGASFLVSMWR